jgi:hypothetical protein
MSGGLNGISSSFGNASVDFDFPNLLSPLYDEKGFDDFFDTTDFTNPTQLNFDSEFQVDDFSSQAVSVYRHKKNEVDGLSMDSSTVSAAAELGISLLSSEAYVSDEEASGVTSGVNRDVLIIPLLQETPLQETPLQETLTDDPLAVYNETDDFVIVDKVKEGESSHDVNDKKVAAAALSALPKVRRVVIRSLSPKERQKKMASLAAAINPGKENEKTLPVSKSPIIDAFVYCALKKLGASLIQNDSSAVRFQIQDWQILLERSAALQSKKTPTTDPINRLKTLARWFTNISRSPEKLTSSTIDVKTNKADSKLAKVRDIITTMSKFIDGENSKLS